MSEPAPQLALPEIQWTFRRWYTYVLTAICAGLIAFIIWRTHDGAGLVNLGLGLCGVIVVNQVLYIAGATATDIWRMIAAGRGVRDSVTPADQTRYSDPPL